MSSEKRNATMVEASRCLSRLDVHPALTCPSILGFLEGNACPRVIQECRHNVAGDAEDDNTIDMWPGDERYEEFKSEFLEPSRLDDMFDPLSITVPYERVFGEPWKLHHCLWAADFTVFRFKGKPGQSRMPSIRDYESYDGGSACGRTFEDLVVKLHAYVIERYGDYTFNDFLTEEERANHAANHPFTRERVELGKEGSGAWVNRLHGNPHWIAVNRWDLNLRWWDWFSTTDEYRDRFADAE